MDFANNNFFLKIKTLILYTTIGITIGVFSSIIINIINFRLQLSLSLFYILLNLLVIVVSISLYKRKVGKTDVFSPFVIPNLLFVLIYILKPLYILITGEVGVGTFNTHFVGNDDLKYINISLFYCLVGIFIYNITLHYVINKGNSNTKFDYRKSYYVSSNINIKMIRSLALVTGIISLVILLWLILNSGGLSAYYQQLSLRNELLKGKGYLLLLANSAKIVLYFLTIKLLFIKNISNIDKLLWLFLFFSVLSFVILTGGRSTLLYGILVLFLLRHYLISRISVIKTFCWGIFAFFLIVIVYRILLRDIHFGANQGYSAMEILVKALKDFPKYFFGGYDVIQFDALMVIIKENANSLPLLGETIKAALLAPIPSSIYPDKEYGAMTYFTKNYFPEFYYPNKVELNVSLFGELYLNFRLLGIVIGISILAFILGSLYNKICISNSAIFLVVYSITILRIVSLIRGDTFNFYSFYFQDIVMVIFIGIITQTKRKHFKSKLS